MIEYGVPKTVSKAHMALGAIEENKWPKDVYLISTRRSAAGKAAFGGLELLGLLESVARKASRGLRIDRWEGGMLIGRKSRGKVKLVQQEHYLLYFLVIEKTE
ncbi:hypothetical protein KFK09_015257 [Dendrobium nobile]|uniref:Uncharacterized protein n=1 Tax=Dendrobium nobile TaxID=94219 RepID=A0A8T3B5M6_DENNO|nr:hypothetical protein KFK09_015257 [Dendrobium nobile]